MTPIKQTIYLQEEEERREIGHNIHWLKPQEGYFFTPEQLNQFISNVIKDTLDTAAENANMLGETQHNNYAPDRTEDFVYVVDSNGPDYGYTVNKQSITDTFDITYKKHKI